jgi:uncharacterized membrane protein
LPSPWSRAHVYIMVLEMFCGRARPSAAPRPDAGFAAASRVLAANQGCQRLLAAGLLWACCRAARSPAVALDCVIVAGVFGAASRKILYVQALPATVALTLWLAWRAARLAAMWRRVAATPHRCDSHGGISVQFGHSRPGR